MPITRARDHFDITCDGVQYGLVVERLLKTELRQYKAAIQPARDEFDAAHEPYEVEIVKAKAEDRDPDFTGLAPYPDISEQLFDHTLPVLKERAISITIRDGDSEEVFDAANRRDDLEEFVDAWIPEKVIGYWGRMMREAKLGKTIARVGLPD